MQKGLSLQELITETNRRSNAAVDYIAPTNKIDYQLIGEGESQKLALNLNGHAYIGINDTAHRQIASHTGIPVAYYNHMMSEAPKLLVDNVVNWFQGDDPKSRLICTLDGNARAFLSDRYRRLDNNKVVTAALETLTANDTAVPLASQVTDNRLYLKILFPDVVGEVKEGDQIHPAVLITNSEVGMGSLNVKAFFYRSYCTNGCVFGTGDMFDFSRRHLGGRIIEGVDYQVLSDDTLKAEDEVLMKSVRDTVKAAADPVMFEKVITSLRNAADTTRIVNPEKSIEVLAKEVGLSDVERQAALINLIEDKDYSQYGAMNAVTKIANTNEDFDRVNDLEHIGGKILQLPAGAWERIAVAA